MNHKSLAFKTGSMRAWAIYDELAKRPVRFRNSTAYIEARINWRLGWVWGTAGRVDRQGLGRLASLTVRRARQRRTAASKVPSPSRYKAERARTTLTPVGVLEIQDALSRWPTMGELEACKIYAQQRRDAHRIQGVTKGGA